ncbi:MAG: aminotransferase class I/II-fold pyridoxal phosphate-dependent enzyme [Planctomycetota bacterium]
MTLSMDKSKPFIPFSRPSIGDEEIASVVDTLRSGWITTGPKTKEFEDRFAEYVGAKHAIALSSCTAGLHLAFIALGIGEGDEVITSPMTFAATTNMMINVGAIPVFADIDPGTRQILPEKIEACITKKTKLIVPVHFAGSACDMDRIMAISERHGIPVLEDAAHAAGTLHKGRKIGSLGNMAIFSFHPIKNMTTGEGGMVTVDDPSLAEKIALLKFHGLAKDAWKRYSEGEVTQYDVLLPGFKYNMMDIQAALGLQQLKRLDGFNEERGRQAEYYNQHLKGMEGIRLPMLPDYSVGHIWHLYTVLIDTPHVSRDTFMKELSSRGIGSGLHFKAVHLHHYYKERFGFERGFCPNAEFVSDRIVSLPLFPGLSRSDQDRVIRAIGEILEGGRS